MMSVLNRNPRTLHRSRESTAATDEFWFSPTAKDVMPSTSDNDGSTAATAVSGGDDHDDSMIVVAMPPAHDQLLFEERASSEALKGYDHTRDARGNDEHSWCRQKLSAVKQQGGGSWLLGSFARLTAEATAAAPPPAGDADAAWAPPGLVRSPSGASLASDEDASAASAGDGSADGSRRAVSFAPAVAVRPIPHSAALSNLQRYRMYTTSVEVRQNKIRNKIEFRHDGYNWRAAAEEWEMGVDMVTGELVHPAHEHM